jgi:hypothetical protein
MFRTVFLKRVTNTVQEKFDTEQVEVGRYVFFSMVLLC